MAIASSQPHPLTGDDLIDAATHGYYWILDGTRTIKWALANGFAGEFWTAPSSTATAISTIFSNVSYYANVNFSYAGYFSSPSTAYAAGADISISPGGSAVFGGNTSIWAIGVFPNLAYNSIYVGMPGDIFLNINSLANFLPSYAPGSAGHALFLHEIGHTLGLKHPFDDGGTGHPTLESLGFPQLDFDWFTVMAYNDDYNYNVRSWDPATPMAMDVLALQYLYGKNNSTNVTNSTYTLPLNNFYQTIWDAGGTDVINVSASPEGWIIALPSVQLSSLVDTKTGFAAPASQLSLPSPLTLYWLTGDLENVTGSIYGDFIAGNQLPNILFGNGGDDVISGGLGLDTIDGGIGVDTAVYESARNLYFVGSNGVSVIVSGPEGVDTLSGIEKIQFSDIQINVSDLNASDLPPPNFGVLISTSSNLNGDSKTDLIIRHNDGIIEYRLMDGGNLISYRDDFIPTYWHVVGTDSDFNADGRSDLVIRHDDGTVEYRLMNGVNLLGFRDDVIPNYWHIVSTDSDFNGDHMSDVVLRHDNGTIEYRLMSGTNLASFKDDPIPAYWHVVTTHSDLNGDGKSDVILRNENGIVEYRLMDGGNLSGFRDDPIPSYWDIVSTDSDFNGDGKADVVLRHENGFVEYRLMDGTTLIGFKDELIPTYWQVLSTDSDFNGDGKSDVMLRHDNGTIEYRIMNGLSMVSFKDDPIPSYWDVVSAQADLNGDGKSDVILRHDNGTIEYRFMDGVNLIGYRDDFIPTYWHVTSPDTHWQMG